MIIVWDTVHQVSHIFLISDTDCDRTSCTDWLAHMVSFRWGQERRCSRHLGHVVEKLLSFKISTESNKNHKLLIQLPFISPELGARPSWAV